MRHTPKRQRGFSLVEACVTSTIAAIVTAAAAPSFATAYERRQLDAAADRVLAELHWARSEAAVRREPVRLSVYSGAWGHCTVVHTGSRADCRCDAAQGARCGGDAALLRSTLVPISDGVALQAQAGSTAFDPVHGTATPANTLRVSTASGRTVQHTVNVMGRVRSCSPQGGSWRTC